MRAGGVVRWVAACAAACALVQLALAALFAWLRALWLAPLYVGFMFLTDWLLRRVDAWAAAREEAP